MMLMGLRVAHLNVNLLVWASFSLSRGVISLKPLFFHRLVFVTKLCAHVYLVYKAEHQVSSLLGTWLLGPTPTGTLSFQHACAHPGYQPVCAEAAGEPGVCPLSVGDKC